MALNDNFKGALLMTASMAGFTINDAMVKMVSPLMNVGQIMFLRGAMTCLLVFLVAWKLGALRPISVLFDRMILWRVLAEGLASIAYLTALALMPLANTASILQALPLAVTLGAALFLREPVGWRRWMAILAGFAGVLIIIRPGTDGFSLASLLVVFCVITAAARDLITRKIPADIPSLFVTTVTSGAISLMGAALIVPYGGWQPVTWNGLWPLMFGATMLFLGYQAIIMSMRTGEVSFIAPFRYTSLLWALVLGVFLLGETLDAYMLTGSVIIVAAGLYSFYRERARQRALASTSENPNAV